MNCVWERLKCMNIQICKPNKRLRIYSLHNLLFTIKSIWRWMVKENLKKCFKTSEFEIPFIVTVAIACVTNNQFCWRFFNVWEDFFSKVHWRALQPFFIRLMTLWDYNYFQLTFTEQLTIWQVEGLKKLEKRPWEGASKQKTRRKVIYRDTNALASKYTLYADTTQCMLYRQTIAS